MMISIQIFFATYCENQLLHAVGGHAVEVGEMQLQVDLVAQDVLAQWAADHRLHGMLGHDMELHAVGVFAAVVAIRALLNLWGTDEQKEGTIISALHADLG